MFGPTKRIKVPPLKKGKRPNDRWLQLVLADWWTKAAEQGETVQVDPSRNNFLRPSALPFCPLKVAYTRITEGVETERHRSFNENFYTDIGHAVHELLQNFVGRMKIEHGVQTDIHTLGHWKCPACKTWRYFTTYKRCKCGGRPHYEEIEIKWRNTIGHIDKVIRIGKWLFILDYKTTGVKAIYKHRDAKRTGGEYLPYLSNRSQISRYVGLFEHVFAKEFKKGGKFEGCEIAGAVLAYVSRESLYMKEFVFLPFTRKGIKRQYKKAVKDDRDFMRMRAAVENRDRKIMLELIDEKPCKTRKDYDTKLHDPFEPCPLLKVCFKCGPLKETVLKALKETK